jgi:hypothetical protein
VGILVTVRSQSLSSCPEQRCSRCLPRCVIPWMVLALLFGGCELTAALWGNDSAHPTFSLLLDPVLETYPGRLPGWLARLGIGRWLVTR